MVYMFLFTCRRSSNELLANFGVVILGMEESDDNFFFLFVINSIHDM